MKLNINESNDLGVRECTNKLLDAAENGVISYRGLAMAALQYMSEDEVRDMARLNDYIDTIDSYE